MESIQRFRIDGVLGRGGMGTVYRAWDPELERAVALKVLDAGGPQVETLDDHRTVDLREGRPHEPSDLLAEARAMAAISHPNVLPIYEVGRLGDRVFLVMELVDGTDLRQWLAAHPHTASDVLAVLEDSARGLSAAHDRGVVHGDFKPDNVLVKPDGRAVVADFGVSSFVVPRQALVYVGEQRGTPAYLAPEVWRGSPPSPMADVFSFSMTAVEALLGERPPAPEKPEELAAIESALAAREVPPHARSVILAGLAADPHARPKDGAALVVGLRRVGASPRRRKGIFVIAAGGVAIAAGLAARFLPAESPSCDPDPERYANVWSEARAKELRAVSFEGVGELVATLDQQFVAAAEGVTRACRDRANGRLGSQQHAGIVGCLDRFALDVDMRIAFARARPADSAIVLRSMPEPSDCAGRLDPPMASPTRQRELLARYFAAFTLPAAERRRELATIPDLAVANGDHELAARVLSASALGLASSSDLPGAYRAMQAARGFARQAGATSTELRVLAEHMRIARTHTDLGLAKQLAGDVRTLLDGHASSPSVERALTELALLARDLGDHREARQYLQQLLAKLDGARRGASRTALDRRLDLVVVTARLEEPPPREFREFVETTERLVETHFDKATSPDYLRAISMLVSGYRLLGDRHADELWRRALDGVRAVQLGPGDSTLAFRMALAGEMFIRENFEEALAMQRDVVRDSAPERVRDVNAADVAFRSRRHDTLSFLALMLRSTNRADEAHGLYEEALLLAVASVGPAHAQTRQILESLIGIELDQRDFVRAERHILALERAGSDPPAPIERAHLAAYRAQLARLRGDLPSAEKLAREAVAAVTEVAAERSKAAGVKRELGLVLVAANRTREALGWLREALPPVEQRTALDCPLLFQIAQLERILDEEPLAIEHASWCVARLGRSPVFAEQRAEIEAWLSTRPP